MRTHWSVFVGSAVVDGVTSVVGVVPTFIGTMSVSKNVPSVYVSLRLTLSLVERDAFAYTCPVNGRSVPVHPFASTLTSHQMPLFDDDPSASNSTAVGWTSGWVVTT